MAVYHIDASLCYVAPGGDVIVIGLRDASNNEAVWGASGTFVPSTNAYAASIKINGGSDVTLAKQATAGPQLLLRVQDSGATIASGNSIALTVPTGVFKDGTDDVVGIASTVITNNINEELAPLSLSGYGSMKMGMNVLWKQYYAENIWPRNIMKQARSLMTRTGGTYTTYDSDTGLPTATDGTAHECIINHDRNAWPNGTFRVRWQGGGSVTASLSVGTETGTSAGSPGVDGVWKYRDFSISTNESTSVVLTGVPFTHIEVLIPGYTDNTSLIRDQLHTFYGGMVLRFMQAANINQTSGNAVKYWSQRKPANWYTWAYYYPGASNIADSGTYSQANTSDPGGMASGWNGLRHGTVLQPIEITTDADHGLETGDTIHFTSSSVAGDPAEARSKLVAVTGAKTFVVAGTTGQTFSGDIFTSVQPGMQYEDMITAAEEMGSDLWLTVPGGANDAYCNSLADLLLANMPSWMVAYIEFSNEIWNSQYAQAFQNAFLNGVTGGTYDNWHAERTAEVHALFVAKFTTAGKRSKLHTTIGCQYGSPTSVEGLLTDYRDWCVAEEYSFSAPDSVAPAPYQNIAGWYWQNDDAGNEDGRDFLLWAGGDVKPLSHASMCLLMYLYNGYEIHSRMPTFLGSLSEFNSTYGQAVAIAAYEGMGPGIEISGSDWNGKSSRSGTNYTTTDGEEYTDQVREAQRHPLMRSVMLEAMRGFQDSGFVLFCNYCESRVAGGTSESANFGCQERWDMLPGLGDGSDGLYDNRLDLSDSNIVNHVSPRLYAMQEFEEAEPTGAAPLIVGALL